jgi:DNA-directed RNA polymerase specialized sigma24 family protein
MTPSTAIVSDPLDLVLAKEERMRRLKAALLAMTPVQRSVLIMYESLGIAPSEIRRRLRCNEATVVIALERARMVCLQHGVA